APRTRRSAKPRSPSSTPWRCGPRSTMHPPRFRKRTGSIGSPSDSGSTIFEPTEAWITRRNRPRRGLPSERKGIATWVVEKESGMSDQDLLARIVANPKVMVGKPVIRGTRLTVEFILNRLGHGTTIDELLQEYPGHVKDDIHACLVFASQSLAS